MRTSWSEKLIFDAFSAHLTDKVKGKLIGNNSDISKIFPGYTSKFQPMDVCINKPFKGILRKCWTKYVSDVVDRLSIDTNCDSNFKLPPPTRQHRVDWIEEGYNFLLGNREMVEKSFDVCGITTNDSSKIRSAAFYQERRRKSNGNEEVNDEDEDPFVLLLFFFFRKKRDLENL